MEAVWLILVSDICVTQGQFRLRFRPAGQWALPCNTPDTLSFTFGFVDFPFC